MTNLAPHPSISTHATPQASSTSSPIDESHIDLNAEAILVEEEPIASEDIIFLQKPNRSRHDHRTPTKSSQQSPPPPSPCIKKLREELSQAGRNAEKDGRAKRRLDFENDATNPLLLMKKDGWSLAKRRRLMDKRGELLT